MGYDVHITRADDWAECQGKEITFAEWLQLVADDPELEIDYSDRLTQEELEQLIANHPEFSGCKTDHGFRFTREQARRLEALARELKEGETPKIEELGWGTAWWTAHPQDEASCFWYWKNGYIETTNPDMLILNKSLEIAEKLGAYAQGDDGEIYRHSHRGFECFDREESERGWQPLEVYHRGRPFWGRAIIREIALSKRPPEVPPPAESV